MSDTLNIDPQDFTLGELEEIETITGKPAGELFTAAFSTTTIKAMVYIMKRREDPDFTVDDASDFRLSDLGGLFDADEVPPTGSNA